MPIPTRNALAPQQRVLLRDVVRERVRDAIMDGTLTPGELLHDEELQTWLGVSRTPIRDALNELTRAGLVEMSPNRYTRVALPSESEVLSALNALGVIFGGVVRLAIPNLDEEATQAIVADIDLLTRAARADDQETLNTLTPVMFNRFVEKCDNSLLVALCRNTVDGLAYKLRVNRLGAIVDYAAMALEFEQLKQATLDKDPIAAELATENIHQLPGIRPVD